VFSDSCEQQPAKRPENSNQITGFLGTVKQRDQLWRTSLGNSFKPRPEPASTHPIESGSLAVEETSTEPEKQAEKRVISYFSTDFPLYAGAPKRGLCVFAHDSRKPIGERKRPKKRKKAFLVGIVACSLQQSWFLSLQDKKTTFGSPLNLGKLPMASYPAKTGGRKIGGVEGPAPNSADLT